MSNQSHNVIFKDIMKYKQELRQTKINLIKDVQDLCVEMHGILWEDFIKDPDKCGDIIKS